MDPVMLNTLITYISNHFYCNLKERDFFNLGLFLSLLSKEMLEMNAIRDICRWEKEKHADEKKGDNKYEKKDNQSKGAR